MFRTVIVLLALALAGALSAAVPGPGCAGGGCAGGAAQHRGAAGLAAGTPPGAPHAPSRSIGRSRQLAAAVGSDVAGSPESVGAPDEEAVVYSEVLHREISREQFFDIFLTSLVALMILITFWELLVGPTPLGQVVPTAAFSLFLGMLFGYMMRVLDLAEPERGFMKFSDRLFLFVLLPPIIYESAFMMDRKLFFHNAGTIMLIVIPGVVLSTSIIGMVTYWVGKAGLFTHDGRTPLDFSSPLQPMLFGSLISATDPVATLAILSTVSIPPVLFVLIFGESLLNDAVSIVLYKVLKWYGAEAFSWHTLPVVVFDFVAISVGSVLVGSGIGLLSAYVHKQLIERTFHSPSGEMTSILLFGYISYTLAESVNLSGITALVVAGICQRYYTFYSISHEAQHASHHVLKLIASKAEQFVFVYLGINVFLVSGSANPASESAHREWGSDMVLFAAFMLIMCMVSRLVMVLLLCTLANWRRKSRKIKHSEMVLMWWAGLRGAMAFALAKDLNNEVIVSLTIVVVLFTTFVCGCSTSLIVSRLGLVSATAAKEGPSDTLQQQLREIASSTAAGIEMSSTLPTAAAGAHPAHPSIAPPMNRRQSFALLPPRVDKRQRHWDQFDRKWMRPLFGGPGVHIGHAQSTQITERIGPPTELRARAAAASAAPQPPAIATAASVAAAAAAAEHHHAPHAGRQPSLAVLARQLSTGVGSRLETPPSELREEKATCILDLGGGSDESEDDEPLVLVYEEEPIEEGEEGDEDCDTVYAPLPTHLRLAPREPHEWVRTSGSHSEDEHEDSGQMLVMRRRGDNRRRAPLRADHSEGTASAPAPEARLSHGGGMNAPLL
ncbi:hypothetical protein KFE25_008886 [Diacronema lutheri]|uniref:Sodium/hydrogen exchanger n=4 Tax=Diacronema lutheri TaxID=2081491 RepID=A0A8J6CHP8_DIALT|nr:hypothetical protein KFE25_008886 [Diacronema lutheri]